MWLCAARTVCTFYLLFACFARAHTHAHTRFECVAWLANMIFHFFFLFHFRMEIIVCARIWSHIFNFMRLLASRCKQIDRRHTAVRWHYAVHRKGEKKYQITFLHMEFWNWAWTKGEIRNANASEQTNANAWIGQMHSRVARWYVARRCHTSESRACIAFK